MRIKKRKIVEGIVASKALNNNATPNNNNSADTLPNSNELNKVSNELNDIKQRMSELPFFKEVNENGEPNYGKSDDLDYLSSIREKLMNDYNDWLNSPEGVDYMNNLYSETPSDSYEKTYDDLPFGESFKSTKKVIRTIKVKDLK